MKIYISYSFSNPMPHSGRPAYFKSQNFNFYNITNEGIFLEKDPYHSRMEFWNGIFDEYKHLWNNTFDFHLI